MLVNLASCAAYWVVKLAGICCTRNTAAGKSRVKPGARRMTVAGPPVEAPSTTMGKRWSSEADCGWRATGGRGTAGPVAGAPLVPCTVDAIRDAVRTTRTFADMRTLR